MSLSVVTKSFLLYFNLEFSLHVRAEVWHVGTWADCDVSHKVWVDLYWHIFLVITIIARFHRHRNRTRPFSGFSYLSPCFHSLNKTPNTLMSFLVFYKTNLQVIKFISGNTAQHSQLIKSTVQVVHSLTYLYECEVKRNSLKWPSRLSKAGWG